MSHRTWVVLIMMIVLAQPEHNASAQAPADLQAGQKVEVREGDEWSPATILKKEGRKYQVQYEGDPTQEWVTADRIRTPGHSPATAPAKPMPAAPLREPVWNNGQKVDVKWGGLWFDAVVKNRGNGWYLVEYQQTGGFEWVEPWRLRATGSNEDTIPHAPPGKRLRKPEPPPTVKPGPRPANQPFGATDVDPTLSEHAPIKEADRANVHEIILGSTSAKWSLTPDPARAPAPRAVAGQPVVLRGGSGDVFQKVTSPVFASEVNHALLIYLDTSRDGRAAVERVDLGAGRSLGVVQLPVIVTPLDVSSDGKRLLARTAGIHFAEAARLDVWTVDASQPAHVVSFVPYGDRERHERNIAWARYIGQDRVATMNGEGRLIAWDAEAAKAIWSADVANVTPALSGGSGQMAVVVESQLLVINPADGASLASMDLAMKPSSGRLSFRPDGKQLALASDGVLKVWDVATGRLVSESPYDGGTAESIDWSADGFVLVNGEILIDLAQKMPLWRYQGTEASGSFAGRLWYIVPADSGGKNVLASAVIPADAVQRAAAGAGATDIWAAKPGTSVTIDAGGLPGDIQADVVEALKRKLTTNGFTPADGQPIRLVASVEAGTPQEIQYHGFGQSPFSGGTKVTATPQTSRIAFVDSEGKVLWERQATRHPPMMASLKEGQTIEQYVADATRPDARFFSSVTLPRFVPKAQYRNGLGASRFTARGVVDAPPAK